MKPTVTLLIGNPLSGEEARFLCTLHRDLLCADALILANFHVADRQIDFLVVTVGRAAILELKHLWTAVFGRENGPWAYLDAGGKRVQYPGAKNPYQQTLDQKYALSDQMRAYQSRRPDVPPAAGRAFYADFDAFVCIWPQLHPQSQVTRGDRKVSVRSYSEVIEDLRRGGSRAGWTMSEWRAFAETDLNLTAVTLAQATDARIADAIEKTESYRAKVVSSMGSVLPPLIDTVDKDYGLNLVAKAKEPFNLVLVGPSGSAKTFHLHHLAVALAQCGDEVPLLVQARKHRGGDFLSLLRQGISPFFAGEPKDLLEATRLSGLRPVLLVDALNECEERFQLELLRGVQAFLLRCGARVVMTSQSEPALPADLQATKCDLPLPDLSKKRAIYCHHAGITSTADVEEFCKGFTNAYDLTLAGRCHQAGRPAASPLDVYDRYVRRSLSKHTSVGTALLRHVANEMRLTTSTIWTRDRFERTCEQFLHAEQASLEALDEIRTSRLVDLTDDFFSFEHELLLHYFQAEALRREVPLVADLAAELRKPRHQRLLELILPRFSRSADIKALLAVVDDRSVFDHAFGGLCGAAVQTVLFQECMALLRGAGDDLPNITVDCTTSKDEDGRRLFTGIAVSGNRPWSVHEAKLCHLIARNLDQPAFRDAFLELLDLTEWCLRVAVDAGAARSRFKAVGVWGEAVRVFAVLTQISGATEMELPCLEVLSGLQRVVEAGRGVTTLPADDMLVKRARDGSDFALAITLEHARLARDRERLHETLELAERGWKSGIYILQLRALECLQALSGLIRELRPERVPHILELLNSIDVTNLFLESARVETLSAYDALELGISIDDVVTQLRSLIRPEAVTAADVLEAAATMQISPGEWLAAQAQSCIAKIFEDVYQGIYWEAYSALSAQEKIGVLCLAAAAAEDGLSLSWILRELLQHRDERALPVYQRFAGGIRPDSSYPQGTVAAFVIGIEGCARWSERRPDYVGGDSPEHRAWDAIGEVLYLLFRGVDRGDSRVTEAWARALDGAVRVAVGDVLYQLSHSRWHVTDEGKSRVDLAASFPIETALVAEACIAQRHALPSVFVYGGTKDPNCIRYLIAVVGRAGNNARLPVLQALVDDPNHGPDVLEAIRMIERRSTRSADADKR